MTMEAADNTQMKSPSLTTSDYKINCFYGVVYNTWCHSIVCRIRVHRIESWDTYNFDVQSLFYMNVHQKVNKLTPVYV